MTGASLAVECFTLSPYHRRCHHCLCFQELMMTETLLSVFGELMNTGLAFYVKIIQFWLLKRNQLVLIKSSKPKQKDRLFSSNVIGQRVYLNKILLFRCSDVGTYISGHQIAIKSEAVETMGTQLSPVQNSCLRIRQSFCNKINV